MVSQVLRSKVSHEIYIFQAYSLQAYRESSGKHFSGLRRAAWGRNSTRGTAAMWSWESHLQYLEPRFSHL